MSRSAPVESGTVGGRTDSCRLKCGTYRGRHRSRRIGFWSEDRNIKQGRRFPGIDLAAICAKASKQAQNVISLDIPTTNPTVTRSQSAKQGAVAAYTYL